MSEIVRQAAATEKSKSKAMIGFVADFEELTEENSDFRRVLYSGKNLQARVLMARPPNEGVFSSASALGDERGRRDLLRAPADRLDAPVR